MQALSLKRLLTHWPKALFLHVPQCHWRCCNRTILDVPTTRTMRALREAKVQKEHRRRPCTGGTTAMHFEGIV